MHTVCGADSYDNETFGKFLFIMALSKLSLKWILPDIPVKLVHPPSTFNFPSGVLERNLLCRDLARQNGLSHSLGYTTVLTMMSFSATLV